MEERKGRKFMSFIKVLIADDHDILRFTVGRLIDSEKDMQVVAEADNGMAAVQMAKNHNPDVVIMDLFMPRVNGIDATKMIKSEFPEIKVIALSSNSEEIFVEKMIAAGASEYLDKVCPPKDLITCIRKVSAARRTTVACM